jgi:predicted RNA-binding protein with RPS1 domain
VDRRISHSQEAVREGDVLPLKIIRIERDRHRLGLSLKQARDQGERMGFAFTPDGEVQYVPPELREKFSDEINAIRSESAAAADREQEAEAAPQREAPIAPVQDSSENEVTEIPARVVEEEEDLPQTQMAAAFAAANLDQLASDSPPEETKA